MSKLAALPYVVAMILLIVGVDIIFFRHHALARLMANVGIVLISGALYLAWARHP
jgi:hypothetical protein